MWDPVCSGDGVSKNCQVEQLEEYLLILEEHLSWVLESYALQKYR